MMLRVDPTLPLPVYEQIREQVVRMVAAGTLEPGTQITPVEAVLTPLNYVALCEVFAAGDHLAVFEVGEATL